MANKLLKAPKTNLHNKLWAFLPNNQQQPTYNTHNILSKKFWNPQTDMQKG